MVTVNISYYYADGQRIAMKNNGVVSYLYGDQLGSISAVADTNGNLVSKALYHPWGTTRYSQGTNPTDYAYTGQMQEGEIYFYNSRWYDPELGRFMQADTVVPMAFQGSQAFDRFAYVNNNPMKFTDPSGMWIDTLLDFTLIMYDLTQIHKDGWTPLNTGALVVDVLFAIIPGATGGGPGLRLVTEGGGLILETTRVAVSIPEWLRAGQVMTKGLQFISGAQDTSESTNYPNVEDPRTGERIPQPPDNLAPIPKESRVPWTRNDRIEFIKTWYEHGYKTPPGGWPLYDIHHIIPREFGGTNDFWNLVPIERFIHQTEFNKWWRKFLPQ